MKKIKVHVATNKIGSEVTKIIEFDDEGMDKEDILEFVQETANGMIDIWHEEIE